MSSTELRAKVTQIAGAASTDLAAAGGSYKVALFYAGVELSGNGYSRKTVDSLGAVSVGENNEAAYQPFGAVVTWTAVGAGWTFDEIRVYDSDGLQLRHTADLLGSILDGEDLEVTIRFRRPPDLAVRDTRISLATLARTISQSATFDCTDALKAAILARRNDNHVAIEVPSGQWRFATADVLSALSATQLTANKRLDLIGTGAEVQTQGTQEWGLDECSVMSLQMSNATDVWLQRLGNDSADDAFGPINLHNLAFTIPSGSKGSFIYLGADGTVDPTSSRGSMRGITIEKCSFSNLGYNAHAWLVDEGPGFGWVVDRTRENFGIKIDTGYDVTIRDVGIRNVAEGLRIHRGDGARIDHVHSMFCRAGHVISGLTVPQTTTHLYAEACFATGIYCDSAQNLALCSETGYVNFEPNTGVYDCDESGLTWSIAADSDRIELDDLPSGKDARDYLIPYTLIEITPTTANYTDARILAIGDVDATGADILMGGLDSVDNAKPCNFPVTVAGIDTGLARLMGTNHILAGDRVSNFLSRPARNRNIGRVPLEAFVPGAYILPVGGALNDASSDTGGSVVVAVTTGGDKWCRGGVTQSGGNRRIKHPRRFVEEYEPEFLNNCTSLPSSVNRIAPDGNIYRELCGPLYGGLWSTFPATSFKQLQHLLIRRAPAVDTEMHPGDSLAPFAWRLEDLLTLGWLSFALRKYTSRDVTVRCYAPSAVTGGFRWYDGTGSTNGVITDLASGWQTKTFTTNGAATLLQIAKRTQANVINNLWVAWAGLN